MDSYFSHFCPHDASDKKRKEVNDMITKIEDKVFDRLPWLVDRAYALQAMTDEKVNDVIKCVYDAKMGVL